ncbi:MAG: ABC transporter permease [Eubacteriales bacterium]|nr:ABC transporter permease [Eubacteriales bacterium]
MKEKIRQKCNGYLVAGILIAGVILAWIIIGHFYTPYDPTKMSRAKLQGPSAAHLFGTDKFGRDIFSRVMQGSGTTLMISLATILIGSGFGTLIGAVTGYFGGIVDEILMRLNDALTAFPSILLALVIISILGPGKYNVIVALGIVFIPSYARVMRTAFASQREINYITSARLMGASSFRILFVHMLPNTFRVLLPALTIGFNNAVLAEASMSFLGIGVMPPDVSMGYMLSEAQGMFRSAPWYAISVGSIIALLVFGVSLIGEGLQHLEKEKGVA